MTATWEVRQGDALERLREMPDKSVDAIVTDPPYGLKFMGKSWDHGIPGVAYWEAALRVAKPGSHLLAFGGTRTFHRLMCAIEDAGWEIRDTLMWVYGSGFPKSLSVSKAIDKDAGEYCPGEKLSSSRATGESESGIAATFRIKTAENPQTEPARQWAGWGTALKPAWEPIILARKPLDGTVAQNVQKWGTGALNTEGCRVPVDPNQDDMLRTTTRGQRQSEVWEDGSGFKNEANELTGVRPEGRWPANLIHDGSEGVVELFPASKSCNTPPDATPESKFRPGQGNYQPQGPIYPGGRWICRPVFLLRQGESVGEKCWAIRPSRAQNK